VLGAVEELRARFTGRPPRLTRATVDIFRYNWPLGHDEAAADLAYFPRNLADGVRALLPNQTT
jgi:hypothetical protein